MTFRLGLSLRLFLCCWIVYAAHFTTNIERELYPALALVERGSLDVSEYAGLHDDIFEVPGRGTFINNNPGASLLAAIPLALAWPAADVLVSWAQARRDATISAREYRTPNAEDRVFYQAARSRGLDLKLGVAAGIVQALLMAPLSALAVVVMFRLLRARSGRPRAALGLALLYGIATPIFFHAVHLNHNLLAAHAALFGFALLAPAPLATALGRGRRFAAGLLAGWAVVLDYAGLLELTWLAALALSSEPSGQADETAWQRAWPFGAGALASLCVLWSCQQLCFGSPFWPAQSYMPPGLYSDMGWNGIDWPRLDLLWDTAFGLRFGLFAYAPILAIALWPGAWTRPGIRLLTQRESRIGVAFCVAFAVFCAANQYGRWQWVTGVRYALPVVPLLFVVAAGVLLHWPRPLVVVVSVASGLWSWALTMARVVDDDRGVLAAAASIVSSGPRLPWVTTLERMGYVSAGWLSVLVLLCVAAACAAIGGTGGFWRARQHSDLRPPG